MPRIRTRRSQIGATVAVALGVVFFSCATPTDTPVARDAGASGDASLTDATIAGAAEPETEAARSLVSRLQSRFTFESPSGSAQIPNPPTSWSVLPPALVDHIELAGDHLEAVMQADAAPKGGPGHTEYPLKASGTFNVGDVRSGM